MDVMRTSPTRIGPVSILTLTCLVAFLSVGCGGNAGMASPNTYGNRTAADLAPAIEKADDQPLTTADTTTTATAPAKPAQEKAAAAERDTIPSQTAGRDTKPAPTAPRKQTFASVSYTHLRAHET